MGPYVARIRGYGPSETAKIGSSIQNVGTSKARGTG